MATTFIVFFGSPYFTQGYVECGMHVEGIEEGF
jgi:hypothetical protein